MSSPGTEQHCVISLAALSCQLFGGSNKRPHVQLLSHCVLIFYHTIVTLNALVVPNHPRSRGLVPPEMQRCMMTFTDLMNRKSTGRHDSLGPIGSESMRRKLWHPRRRLLTHKPHPHTWQRWNQAQCQAAVAGDHPLRVLQILVYLVLKVRLFNQGLQLLEVSGMAMAPAHDADEFVPKHLFSCICYLVSSVCEQNPETQLYKKNSIKKYSISTSMGSP